MSRNYREDNKRLSEIMSQQEVIEMYMSYFHNLPMITRNVLGEVSDVYGQFCEDEITEEELLKDKDKYVAFLLSFINFIWTELQSDYDKFEESVDGLSYIFDCQDGTFGEKYDNCKDTMEKLKLASEYGWFVTPNEVFNVKGY